MARDKEHQLAFNSFKPFNRFAPFKS